MIINNCIIATKVRTKEQKSKLILFFMPRRSRFAIFDGKITTFHPIPQEKKDNDSLTPSPNTVESGNSPSGHRQNRRFFPSSGTERHSVFLIRHRKTFSLSSKGPSSPLCGAAATFSGYSKDPIRSEERGTEKRLLTFYHSPHNLSSLSSERAGGEALFFSEAGFFFCSG